MPWTRRDASRSIAGRTFDRVFRNPQTGEVAIAQWPNLPLAIFLVAAGLRTVLHPHGGLGTGLSIVAAVALLWWALDELLRGDSLFRRALGALVLVASLANLLL